MTVFKTLPAILSVKGRWVSEPPHKPQAGYKWDDLQGKTGTIYAVACGEFLKVGLSIDFGKRLAQLQDANPFEVRPVATRTVPRAGLAYGEAWAHAQLADKVHRNEWFRATKEEVLPVLIRAAKAAQRYALFCRQFYADYRASVTPEQREQARKEIARLQAESDASLAAEFHSRFPNGTPPPTQYQEPAPWL